jgi:hypothetical protein
MTPKDAAAYARGKYDLTMDDVRGMRKAVGHWRKVYEARFREIRHKIFAHKSIDRAAADALIAKTNVDEVRELLGFLHALHQLLSQLHMNGIMPNIAPVKFDLPPSPSGGRPGERILTSTIPLSQDTFQITASAAPICGSAGAQQEAFEHDSRNDPQGIPERD